MRLYDVAALYVLWKNYEERPIGKPLSHSSFAQLTEAVGAFSRWLGRPAGTHHLARRTINAFLAALLAGGASPWTVNNRRTALLILWRFAHRHNLTRQQPVPVRTVHLEDPTPAGYNVEGMRRLIAYAATLRHTIRETGLPQALWWEAFLRVKWDASLRAGDMLRVKPGDFDPAGWLWARESKTGKSGWLRLHEETIEVLAEFVAIQPDRERLWLGFTAKSLYRAFRRFAAAAGEPGLTRHIRAGGASEGERLHPGSGWQILRHSTPLVFNRHYRVRRIADRDAPGPPRLGKPA